MASIKRQIEFKLNVSGNENLIHVKRPISDSFSQSTEKKVSNIQTIGTSAHEQLIMGGVSTPGWAYFENKDGTNFVEIGIDSGGTFHPFAKLKAGEDGLIRLAATPYAKADTGDVELYYEIAAD